MPQRSLVIDATLIDDASDCYVIAEVGHNHQGSIQMARELFRTAKECGANAVKLQKRDNKTLFSRELYNKPYENENSFGETYGKHREALEFSTEQYRELKTYARELGITFFATPFDLPSVDFLAALDMPAYKIASGDMTNFPLLTYVAQTGKPLVISTGGATLDAVHRVYDLLMPINPQVCFLQCTAAYPADPECMNLRVIETYRDVFPDSVVGLSDHQNGIAMSLLAFALGARVIEKHFTLNRALKGTDHAFSLEPEGLRKLVRDLKRARRALGDGVKRQFVCESEPLKKMAKKLVAARDLPEGHILTMADIAIKSPGDGIAPCDIEKVIGKRLVKSLAADEAFIYSLLVDAVAEMSIS